MVRATIRGSTNGRLIGDDGAGGAMRFSAASDGSGGASTPDGAAAAASLGASTAAGKSGRCATACTCLGGPHEAKLRYLDNG